MNNTKSNTLWWSNCATKCVRIQQIRPILNQNRLRTEVSLFLLLHKMFHLLAVSHVFAFYENPNINIKTPFGSSLFKWAMVKKRSTYHYTELTQYMPILNWES